MSDEKIITYRNAIVDSDDDVSIGGEEICETIFRSLNLKCSDDREQWLQNVGMQPWKGSLVLCDFLAECFISARSSILYATLLDELGLGADLEGSSGLTVLELGSGLGLIGPLCCTLKANRVILTDGGNDAVLEKCRETQKLNLGALWADRGVTVRHVAWGEGTWTAEELGCRLLVLAADVIYSSEGADALAQELLRIVEVAEGRVVVVLAQEERKVLTVGSERERDVFLEYFREKFCENDGEFEWVDLEMPPIRTVRWPQVEDRRDMKLFQLRVLANAKKHELAGLNER